MAFYVYELFDPRTDVVFYVGKGKGSRILAHEREARNGVKSSKCEIIREIELAGFSVGKRKVGHFVNEQEAFDFEASLVCEYGLDRLANVIPGGGTPRGTPSIFQDRVFISSTAECINRTKNGEIAGITINGSFLDLYEILQSMKARAFEVIGRRGVDWANSISGRFGVTFVAAQ